MLHGHIVDQFLDQHGFAHASTAEQADLAALRIGLQQIDHLDAGFQHLGHGLLLGKAGGLAVDFPLGGVGGQGLLAVDGLPQHIEHTPQGSIAHRHLDAVAGGLHLHTAGHIFAGPQQNAAHLLLPDMLGNLHHTGFSLHLHGKGFFDFGQCAR